MESAPSPLLDIDGAEMAELARSIGEFGFAALADRIRPSVLSTIQTEAEEKLGTAVFAEQSGALSYRANITGLGPVARGFLHDPETTALLTEFFGGTFLLSENISCLTFYSDGDHLGAHLDQPASECSVTIIVYLSARSPDPEAPDTGLVLNIYGEDPDSVAAPRLRIPTRAGTIVLGRGSKIWHERPKLQTGESVVAITGCYKRAG